MSIPRRFFLALACFLLLFIFSAKDDSLAACNPPVKIVGSSYAPTSIQGAYDHASDSVASGGLGLAEFTLHLAGDIFTEDLILDGGTVVLDGGYDCSFATKMSTTGIFGTLTIAGGAANFAGGVNIVSTDQCSFDADVDGYYVGSCAPLPIDCNDNDANINPGAAEICDGVDNNCDGQIDEGVLPTDADGDGYYAIGSCGDPAYTDDCNDADVTINPGALDIPFDGIDQDCNGADLTFAGEVCTNCHNSPGGGLFGGPEFWTGHHAAVTSPDVSCAGCHAPLVTNILPGHYGRTVLSDGNGMVAGMIIKCESCHDPNTPLHPWGTQTVWPKVQAATPNISCDTCHENRAAGHQTTSAHNNRVIDASCGDCHTSDTSVPGSPGTGTLLNDADVDALHQSNCELCHNYTGTRVNAAKVRQAIEQGVSGTQVSCLDCHTAHGEHTVEVGLGDLSYEAPGQLCSNCHVVSTWDEIEGVEHNVPTNGDTSCATCHNSPRQDVIDTIALRADPTNCLDCHADKELTPHGEHDHSATITGSADCIACHTHSDPQIVEVIHGNNCATCHNSPRSEVRDVINSGQAECIDCHAAHDGPAVHNNLGAPADCAACHTDKITGTDFAYIMNYHAHPTLGFTELEKCQRCHNSLVPEVINTINTGKGPTGTPVDCAGCHVSQHVPITDPFKIHFDYILTNTSNCSLCHTVNNNTHLDMVTTSNCSTCHASANQDEFNTLHQNDCLLCHLSPRAEVISLIYDGIAGTQIECISCHVPYGVDFFTGHQDPDHSNLVTTVGTGCGDCHAEPPPLVDPVDPKVHNDCTTCHASNGVLVSFAAGKSAPGDCTTCHTGTWESTHTTAPDHSALVTIGTTGCGACHSEPPPLIDGVDPKVHNACSTCHDPISGALVGLAMGKTFAAGGDCSTCHMDGWYTTHTPEPSHASLVTTTGTDCAGCHDDSLLADAGMPGADTHLGCGSCHDSDGALKGLAIGKDFTIGGDCTTCHGANWGMIHTPGSEPDHSNLVTVTGTGCGSCHDDSLLADAGLPGTDTHLACSSCHNSASGALISYAIGKTFAAGGNCAICHMDTWETTHTPEPSHASLVQTTGTDCASCHDNSLLADAGLPGADTHLGCGSCHDTDGNLKGIAIGKDFTTGGDCTTCHGAVWNMIHMPGNEPDHSSLVTVTGTGCGSCHDDSLLADTGLPGTDTHLDCSSCHNPTSGALISHAIGKTFAAGGNCATCHMDSWKSIHTPAPSHTSLVTVNGTTCGDCHSSPPPLVDPNDPLNHDDCFNCHNSDGALVSYAVGKSFAVGGNCSTCHMNADSSHHMTNFAQTGDCFHCHTSLAVDRPAQAACRECHGTKHSDKGGPPQNYAACAACHDTTPFHAKPPQALGYTRTTYMGKQTGKGRFAIFWSQWTNNGQSQEGTFLEGITPNGDDQGDEGGWNWSNPTLNFDMYPINKNGQNYMVPGFSPPANQGPDSPPPPSSNLALNTTASASGDNGASYRASNAVDGNGSSYWYVDAGYGDEWLKVDLGQSQNINKVVIKWHSSEYAENYEVQVSTNNYSWTRVLDTRSGNGGTDTISFSSRSARYVRVVCSRERINGYGIYELEVYQQ